MAAGSTVQAAAVRALALGMVLATACGERGPQPDFVVHGVGVVVHSDAAFATQPDLAPRLESTLAVALAYWGGSWEQLQGATITLDGARAVECRGVPGAIGCYDGDIRVSTGDQGVAFDCVEQTALVHEVGHAVVGDPEHVDPRWMDFEPVATALDGRYGYDGTAITPCSLALSVWRHPPLRR